MVYSPLEPGLVSKTDNLDFSLPERAAVNLVIYLLPSMVDAFDTLAMPYDFSYHSDKIQQILRIQSIDVWVCVGRVISNFGTLCLCLCAGLFLSAR